MYRGRPAPRGGYPNPPPARPYQAADYRDERSRPRAPYHPPYHGHGPDEAYRRGSPPRRRYPSPGAAGHRGGEYWSGGAPRERSPSPRSTLPIDHNLVITVGNELIGPSGSASSRHQDREYPVRPEYERSRSRGRSRPRSRSKTRSPERRHSPDRSRAKSRGRSKSRGRERSKSRGRERSKSRGRERSKSRGRERSGSRGRSKSRARSKIRSHSRSPDRSPSPDHSRAKSRGRSKSRPRSKSRSRSLSRGPSRARSRGRSKSRAHSPSDSDSDGRTKREFVELQSARRRKELEEMLSLPTKSILKRRNEEDSPSVRSSDSPRADGSMSRVADQLLQAVKGMEPHAVAAMLSELRSDPRMAQRAGLDNEIKEILSLLGQQQAASERKVEDIEDEEKFLYGDADEPKPSQASEPPIDLYGDITEDALYGDLLPPQSGSSQYGSHHSQPAPTAGERYISPDQNITVQVSNPGFPPGTEPLEEGERQAMEEYEKIQDLLKTIGMDLGVTEISKMAARTKERLHGNKPPPKTPTRRQRYSSASSDGSSRSTGSSSSSSSSRSHSWSSQEGDGGRRRKPAPSARSKRDVKEVKNDRAEEVPMQIPSTADPQTLAPPHPGVPIPTYPPPQVHGMMPPNFPPPGYGQYPNYMPYMPQQWPPMYPPPNLPPPPTVPEEFPHTQPYTQPYKTPAGAKGLKCGEEEKGNAKVSERRVSDEQNNESQKQKVLVEREKLRMEREKRMKKKEYLMKELERLRKQQGELLRKKRREKDGHKDPLLQEITHLQETVMTQISCLRKEHVSGEKKLNEIDKVALILGLNPSDRPRKANKMADDPPPRKKSPEKKKQREPEAAVEPKTSSATKQVSAAAATSSSSSSKAAPPDKLPVVAMATAPPPEPFEYYDAGNHWCKNCNVTSGSMFDFYTHLHSKSHRKTLDPYHRPWASSPAKLLKGTMSEEKQTKPAKGCEFLLPVRGFYCLLCKEFFGDGICAEDHVTKHAHNEKYKKQMYENPMYEQRRNLDRQAGLTADASGKKRKHEDDKDKEDKSKHKKEKKDKEKKDVVVMKEEKVKMAEAEVEKKPSKKDQEIVKESKIPEVEKPSAFKKVEDIKDSKGVEEKAPPYSKKEDKYRSCRDEREDDRGGKYSKRDDDSRYKYSRDDENRFRSDRYEEKYKRYPESKSKYDKDRDEPKAKVDKEAVKPQGKPEIIRPELPPRPYDPPKIFSGPSPAMRAKLRKQSMEAGKPTVPFGPAPNPAAASIHPTTATPSTATFGKFTWKKLESALAKEAQKVAAEFIKEDELAAQNPQSPEDSFAKSVAVAKDIAQKLSSAHARPAVTPPWLANGANRGRIRPNLPAPAAVMRKTALTGKPAPLNTFLNIKPQTSTSILGATPTDAPMSSLFSPSLQNTLIAQTALTQALLTAKPQPAVGRPGPFEAMSAAPKAFEATTAAPPPFAPKPVLPVYGTSSIYSIPADFSKPPPPLPFEVKPVPPVYIPPPIEMPVPFVAKMPQINPAPYVSYPVPPPMMKSMSDVAVPGVPESEQHHSVFVKPPPFMNLGDGAQKSEKLKSSLAAAKAKDLFDIFYSSASQTGTSSITKPTTTEARVEVSSSVSTVKSQVSAPKPGPQITATQVPKPVPQIPTVQVTKPQPQPQPPTEPKPLPTVVCSTPKPEGKEPEKSPPKVPQKQPGSSDIQISSVWSMQTPAASPATPTPTIEPAKEITKPKQQSPPFSVQPEAISEIEVKPQPKAMSPTPTTQPEPRKDLPQDPPHNQQSSPQPEPQKTPQTEPLNRASSPDREPLKVEAETAAIPTPQSQSQLETEPESDPKSDQEDAIHDFTPSKPRGRGRGATRGKRAARGARKALQTRSQTRYQTRRSQRGQPEPDAEHASGDSDSAALDTSDPGSSSGLLPTEDAQDTNEEEGSATQMMEVTPETLGLPSDLTSLDFEYDFNFE